MEGEGSKKKNKGEDDGKLHREDDASTIYTRQCATSGGDASKVGSRSLADAGTCEEASEYGSDYLPPAKSSKTIPMMSHSCIKERNYAHF